MKIVRIITRLNIGGPAQQAAGLCRSLKPLGWRTVLVTGRPEPREGEMSDLLNGLALTRYAVSSMRRPLNPVRDPWAWLSVLRILLTERPVLLHTHMAKAGLVGRLAGVAYRRFSRCPLVMVHTFHGHVLTGYFNRFTGGIFRLLERWLAAGSDGLIAVSPSVRDELVRLGIAKTEKIRVVSLGLPLKSFLALPPPQPHRPFRIGLVGRMVPIKNHRLLLEAARRLAPQTGEGPFRFDLYGDGELRLRLEKLSRDWGLTGRVLFHGWARDMARVYSTLEAVVLTSNNEGTPVSLIEALAAGRPVVATDVGGVRDLLGQTLHEEGKAAWCERGILVPPGDPEALASALLRLTQEPERILGMRQAGRDFVRERMSLERLTRDLDGLYRELLKRPPCPQS